MLESSQLAFVNRMGGAILMHLPLSNRTFVCTETIQISILIVRVESGQYWIEITVVRRARIISLGGYLSSNPF